VKPLLVLLLELLLVLPLVELLLPVLLLVSVVLVLLLDELDVLELPVLVAPLFVLVAVPELCAAVDCACASPSWTAMPPTTSVDAASRLADHTFARLRGRGLGLMDVSFGGFTPPSRAPLCACCGRPVHVA
jgi:hypothetical protein